MAHRSKTLPALDQLERGRVYRIRSRNLAFGVYDGQGGFIGIRRKFASRFLATELHWDADEHLGTVEDAEATEVRVDGHIDLHEGTWVCRTCREPAALREDTPNGANAHRSGRSDHALDLAFASNRELFVKLEQIGRAIESEKPQLGAYRDGQSLFEGG